MIFFVKIVVFFGKKCGKRGFFWKKWLKILLYKKAFARYYRKTHTEVLL